MSRSGKVRKLAWSDILSELKSASLNCRRAWVNAGEPHYSQININFLTCKTKSKQTFCGARIANEQRSNRRFLKLLYEHDTKKFWAAWKKSY